MNTISCGQQDYQLAADGSNHRVDALAQCLEDAGVYKRTAEGRAAFLRFVDHVNQEETK